MHKTNLVTLNLGEHYWAKPADPDAPICTLNGAAVEHLVAVKVELAPGGYTLVTLQIEAQVQGQFLTTEKVLGGEIEDERKELDG